MGLLSNLFGFGSRSPLLPVRVPWEVYQTKAEAVAALSKDGGDITEGSQAKPLTDCSLLDVDETCGLTCVRFGDPSWQENEAIAQRQRRLLGEAFGRDRLLLDFANEEWFIGSALFSCIYQMYNPVLMTNGRFALCHLTPWKLELFQWHRDPLAFPSETTPGVLTCGVHRCEFKRTMVPNERSVWPRDVDWATRTKHPFANRVLDDPKNHYAGTANAEVDYCPNAATVKLKH